MANLGEIANKNAKKNRRVVSVNPLNPAPKPAPVPGPVVNPPSNMDQVAEVLRAMKPSTAKSPSVVVAEKPKKDYSHVTIKITKEVVTDKDGVERSMLVMSKTYISDGTAKEKRGRESRVVPKGQKVSHYNYGFDTGYCYYATNQCGLPKWKWDPERLVRYIPEDQGEILLKGLREYYSGATLELDGHRVVL